MEGQLYPVALPSDDDPGAVGIVRITMRKARALNGAIGSLDQTTTVLTCVGRKKNSVLACY